MNLLEVFLGLVAFDWWKGKTSSSSSRREMEEELAFRQFPRRVCRHCGDTIWFDIRVPIWKHLSTGNRDSATPYVHWPESQEHYNRRYAEARAEEREEARRARADSVVTAGSAARPVRRP